MWPPVFQSLFRVVIRAHANIGWTFHNGRVTRCVDILRNCTIGSTRQRVPWIDDAMEATSKVKWLDPKFQTRSKRALENKNKGKTKHTDGTVSTVHEKELKRRSEMIEVFEYIPKKKGVGEPDEVVYCDNKSKQTKILIF
ncbi:hypothetical protein AKJ16_DCAP05970 [Drosera capensis]